MSDGQSLDVEYVVAPDGSRVRVESFKYEVGGKEREQSRRLPMPDEPPSAREIEHDLIAREDGATCAQLAVELANETGVTFTRAREILIATGDADYRRALLDHVESLRAAVEARRVARAVAAERAALVERKNRLGRLVRGTRDEIENEEALLRRTAKITRKETGLAPHRRDLEALRSTLVRQEAELATARADLAAFDAKAGAASPEAA